VDGEKREEAGMKNLLACVVAVLLTGSCGGGGGSDRSADAPVPAPVVDLADPMQVAEAFYQAVDHGDVDAALEWVLPEQQADARMAFEQGMPDLPADYEVVVFTQEDHSEASIVGAEIEVDLRLVDRSWWVCL
jgi:hypothetical protein